MSCCERRAAAVGARIRPYWGGARHTLALILDLRLRYFPCPCLNSPAALASVSPRSAAFTPSSCAHTTFEYRRVSKLGHHGRSGCNAPKMPNGGAPGAPLQKHS